MDKFRAKQHKECGVGGIKCSCCNPYHDKSKYELNQIARAKLKHEDFIKIQGIEYEEDNNESRYEIEEQLLNRENLNLLIDKYMNLDYPVKFAGQTDGDNGYIYAYLPDFGQSACSATGDTVEEALTELEGVKLDVITYMIRAGKEIPMPSVKKDNIFENFENEAEIAEINERSITINWSLKDKGFGQFIIFKSRKDDKWKIDTETMGKKVAKEVLGFLIDSLEKVG